MKGLLKYHHPIKVLKDSCCSSIHSNDMAFLKFNRYPKSKKRHPIWMAGRTAGNLQDSLTKIACGAYSSATRFYQMISSHNRWIRLRSREDFVSRPNKQRPSNGIYARCFEWWREKCCYKGLNKVSFSHFY